VELLSAVGVSVSINELPCEVPDPIRFSEDHTHAAYDAAAAHRFWRALVQIDRVFKLFRSGFLGKVSPVHFFWGSFDLAVTRFSGRTAPLHPGSVPGLPDAVVREPIRTRSAAPLLARQRSFPLAAFYSYAYPEPAAFVMDGTGRRLNYDMTFKEFILPTTRCVLARTPTLRCATSCQLPMQLPLRAATGIARRWNAPWVFQRGSVRSPKLRLVDRPGHSPRQRGRRGRGGLGFPRGHVDDAPPRLDALRVRRLDRLAESRHHQSRSVFGPNSSKSPQAGPRHALQD